MWLNLILGKIVQLNHCFQDSGFGAIAFVVPNVRLGVHEVVVQGERGSLMTVIVHFVHNIILPHIFERKLYLMKDVVDDSFMPKKWEAQTHS